MVVKTRAVATPLSEKKDTYTSAETDTYSPNRKCKVNMKIDYSYDIIIFYKIIFLRHSRYINTLMMVQCQQKVQLSTKMIDIHLFVMFKMRFFFRIFIEWLVGYLIILST